MIREIRSRILADPNVPSASDVARISRTLRPFAYLYESQTFGGGGDIIKDYLGLDRDFVLPVTIPHGVDCHVDVVPSDLHLIEPVYLASRADVGERAERTKLVLYFPHPWLLLPAWLPKAMLTGTLFVGAPSSEENNERLFAAIQKGDYPKPWGIMLKFRALDPGDFAWWRERGFTTHTAGPTDSAEFYLEQRRILAQYSIVAVPYLSTLAIFAAQMGIRVMPVPNMIFEAIVPADYQTTLLSEDRGPFVRRSWAALLDPDPRLARAEAELLLGRPYLKSPEEMRRSLFAVMTRINEPIYLRGVKFGWVKRVIAALVRCGLPAHKLLPTPFATLVRKARFLLNRNEVAIMSGSEFSHFRIVGVPADFRFTRCLSKEVGHRVQMGEGLRRKR